MLYLGVNVRQLKLSLTPIYLTSVPRTGTHLRQSLKTSLRTVCRKDRLTVYKIEKIDFLKICQNKGLGKLVHKIYLSDRLEVYLFFDEFFRFAHGSQQNLPQNRHFCRSSCLCIESYLEKINPGYKTLLFHEVINGVKSN